MADVAPPSEPTAPARAAVTPLDPAQIGRFLALSPDLFAVVDLSGAVRYANPAWREVLGFEPGEVVGRHLREFLLREDWRSTERAAERAIAEGALEGFENRFRRRDGGTRWLQWNIKVDAKQGVAYGVGRDTTARRNSEAALAESEASFRALFESRLEGVMVMALGGEVLAANDALLDILGRARDDTTPLRRDMVFDPSDPRFERALSKRTSEGQFFGELTLLRADGSGFPAEVSAVVFEDASREPRVSVVVRDVSERRALEDALRTTAERVTLQATAMRAAANAIVITDPLGTIEWVNPAFTRFTGFEPDEAIGRNMNLLHSGEHSEAFYQRMWATIQAGRVWRGEVVNRRKDGTLYPESQTVTPVLDADGSIVHFVAIKQDITESLRAKQELQDSEERYRMLAENAVDVVFRLRAQPTFAFEYVSPSAVALTGYTPEEHYADPAILHRVVHPDDLDALTRTASRGEPYLTVVRYFHRDGHLVFTEQQGRPIVGPDGQVEAVEGIIRDVTPRVLAEQRVTSLNARLKAHLGRFKAIHRIDTTILVDGPLRTVLRTTLQQVMGHLQIDAATVYRIDAARDRLTPLASRGMPKRAVTLSLEQGIAGEVARTSTAVKISDVHEDSEHDTMFLADFGFRGSYALPLISMGKLEGVLEFFTHQPLQLDDDAQVFAEAISQQIALAIQRDTLVKGLEDARDELQHAYDDTIEGWARALDLKDEETAGHSGRVTDLTLRLAKRLGVRDDQLQHIRRGALLHDIGKMGVPDSILLKPGRLTDEEFEVVKRHPVYAYDMLRDIAFLRPAMTIPRSHHERWDGTGYPDRLAGEAIPLAARIFAVADVFDALTSDRPYRRAWSRSRALEHIREGSGTHFDPDVVAAFVALEVTPEASEDGG